MPEQVRATGAGPQVKEEHDEDGRDLRPGVLGPAEGGQHDCQPDGGTEGVRRRPRVRVPEDWVFEDAGYSGASLVRPGLERIRDLAAEGHIQAVLVHAPDRLSRKYAYQVLLTEEFSRHGVETVFIKAPQSATPEDQLLVQFQGMIAEYERAQILERSRRGKRHRAKAGEVAVLAPRPTATATSRRREAPARFEIVAAEAEVVRLIFDNTPSGLSIGAIARLLTREGAPDPPARPVGNARRCGACCAIPPTRAPPASARRRRRRASG